MPERILSSLEVKENLTLCMFIEDSILNVEFYKVLIDNKVIYVFKRDLVEF